MTEKKKIDKLFKEQLKDFEVAPEDHIWEQIEERLHADKRKKRRVIPIWWRVAGVAAGLILLFTVANQVFNSSDSDKISNDTIVNDSNLNDDNNPENNTLGEDKNKASEAIISNDNINEIANTDSEDISDDEAINSNSSEDTSTNPYKLNPSNSDDNNRTTIASQNSNRFNPEKDNSELENSATQKNNLEELLDEKRNPIQNNSTKDAVANTTNKSNSSDSDPKSDLQNEIKNKTELKEIVESVNSETNTTVAQSNIEDNKDPDTEDTTSEVITDPEDTTNAIENAIAEAEDTDEKEKEDENLNRWSVSPNVAPVYFGSLGEGSAIDNQFVDNTKEAEINMSYGISGSYAVNNKLKIRAGVNRVQLGYQTNDVLIFENTNEFAARNSNQMANLDMVSREGRFSVYSANSFKFENAPATLFTQEQGSLDQQLGFIEVPVELEYNLVERKIGLNLIGGFSALFLNENDIFAVFNNGERARLGEASNIRDLSYSANFGIGLDYNFSKQFQFNLEPTFKYQINTFNNTSGDFNPFFIGVYTGLSFKF